MIYKWKQFIIDKLDNISFILYITLTVPIQFKKMEFWVHIRNVIW